MFFLIWGSSQAVVPIRDTGVRFCRACRQARPAILVLRYDYAHFFFAFGFVTRERFQLSCQKCGNSWDVPETEVPDAQNIAKQKIPFLRRWGMSLFLLVGGLVVSTVIYLLMGRAEENFQRRQQEENAPLRRVVKPAPTQNANEEPPSTKARASSSTN